MFYKPGVIESVSALDISHLRKLSASARNYLKALAAMPWSFFCIFLQLVLVKAGLNSQRGEHEIFKIYLDRILRKRKTGLQ